MAKSDEIIKLLAEGKTSGEIIAMGYKKGTVYSTQRKWRRGKAEASSIVNKGSKNPAGSNQQSISALSDIESDPEIVQLKKEIRIAELNRQLAKAKAPSEVEALVTVAQEIGQEKFENCYYKGNGLCTHWEWSASSEIHSGIGELVLDEEGAWRIKPTALYCAMCTLPIERDIEVLEEALWAVPFRNIQDRFTCECGPKGMLAFFIKCTKCEKETWSGWWPEEK